MKRKPLRLLCTLVSSSIWVHGLALACSCPPGELPAPKAALESSEAVFLGVVEKFETDKQLGQTPLRVATFRVNTAWKGIERPLIKVSTRLTGSECGYDFVVGQEYLVYAYRLPNGSLGTNICQRTRQSRDAHEDLQALGAGTTEWAEAEHVLKRYGEEHGLVLREIEPEWFAASLPNVRLYQPIRGDLAGDKGPFLLKRDGTLVSLYRGWGPLFEAIQAANVILKTDRDAEGFTQALFRIMYGETRQLLRVKKAEGGWEFEWGLGWHRGIIRLHLDKQGKLTDITTVAE